MSRWRIFFIKIVQSGGKHGAKSSSSPSDLLPYKKHHLQLPLSPKHLRVWQTSTDRRGEELVSHPLAGSPGMGLERVMLKSMCRKPKLVLRGEGCAHVVCCFCLFLWGRQPSLSVGRTQLHPCWGSARALTRQETFQLRIPHGNRGLVTHGGQQYHLLC